MASFTYDAGSYGIQHRDIDWLGDTIKIMFVQTPYVPSQTDANMSGAAAAELATTGYVPGFGSADRKTLGTKTLTNDNLNRRTVYNAANPTAWILAAGVQVAGAIIYKHVTNDTASIPIWFLDLSNKPTTGAAFTLDFNSVFIAWTQQ